MFGKDDKLTPTGLDPGARGVVHTETDENGNTKLKVEVEHAATPQQLNPPHQYYVVWIAENGKPPKALGELKVRSEDAKGTLEAVASAKVFDVFVTAEDTPNPETPSGAIVVQGHVDRS
jgi:hypothetical protein